MRWDDVEPEVTRLSETVADGETALVAFSALMGVEPNDDTAEMLNAMLKHGERRSIEFAMQGSPMQQSLVMAGFLEGVLLVVAVRNLLEQDPRGAA